MALEDPSDIVAALFKSFNSVLCMHKPQLGPAQPGQETGERS